MDKDWIFKVSYKNGAEYKIWADGRTEGFDAGGSIINKIPCIIAEAERESASMAYANADCEPR